MKIAINKCYGGFHLSDKANKRLIELGVKYFDDLSKVDYYDGVYVARWEEFGDKYTNNFSDYENRTNSLLIQTIEELGKEANGRFGKISIVDIPDDVDWEIDDYDGIETVREKHRCW
jgi:hypothetical protein